jgi:cell division protein FtsA
VSRGFGEYIKITHDIIDDMECENQETFQTPEGYKRLQVDTQEYRFEGNVDYNPIGAPTKFIECNYLNIIMKEQFYKQLCESFAQADIEIEDCFSAARLDADIMLSNDLRRNGCALVNIGAETTTISIYGNDKPKMLTVLPLGSKNITRDLTAERISFAQAEEIKITRGYKSSGCESNGINSETVNNIINARMGEILQNVRYQIEESGERVHHIVFTGGGSKLKNLKMLLEEFLPNFSTDIKPEPQLNLISESGINVNGVITTALYGLLKQGKENCCEDIMTQAQMEAQQNGEIFSQIEMEGIEEHNDEKNLEEERRRAKEEERQRKEEEKKRKEEEKKKREEEKKRQKEEERKQRRSTIGSLFDFAKAWVNNATSEDENKEDDTTNNQ